MHKDRDFPMVASRLVQNEIRKLYMDHKAGTASQTWPTGLGWRPPLPTYPKCGTPPYPTPQKSQILVAC